MKDMMGLKKMTAMKKMTTIKKIAVTIEKVWYKVRYELPAMLWAGMIFLFSSQEAEESSELSSGVLGFILGFVEGWLGRSVEGFDQEFFHFLIRKGAHFSVYLVLGILLAYPLKKRKVKNYGSISLLLSVLYAITDEIHQVFVPGRAGQIQDVMIDSCGALVGVVLFVLFVARQRKIILNHRVIEE